MALARRRGVDGAAGIPDGLTRVIVMLLVGGKSSSLATVPVLAEDAGAGVPNPVGRDGAVPAPEDDVLADSNRGFANEDLEVPGFRCDGTNRRPAVVHCGSIALVFSFGNKAAVRKQGSSTHALVRSSLGISMLKTLEAAC